MGGRRGFINSLDGGHPCDGWETCSTEDAGAANNRVACPFANRAADLCGNGGQAVEVVNNWGVNKVRVFDFVDINDQRTPLRWCGQC